MRPIVGASIRHNGVFMTRQQANLEILRLLTEYAKLLPDWRFGQLVSALGIEWVSFYEEPQETLERLQKNQFKFEFLAIDKKGDE